MLYGSGPMRGDPDKYKEKNRDGYSPLYASFESFYTRNIYRRLKNVFNQPIASVPGAKVTLIDRESGKVRQPVDSYTDLTSNDVSPLLLQSLGFSGPISEYYMGKIAFHN